MNDDLRAEIDKGISDCVDDAFAAVIDLGERLYRQDPSATISDFLQGIRALRGAVGKGRGK